MLKPQDVVLALKLLCKQGDDWSQGGLAQEVVMSASEVNAGLKRLAYARLTERQDDGRKWQVVKPAIEEFLVHGIRFVFPAQKGAPAVGIPTAYAASPLKLYLSSTPDPYPVWPTRLGKVKGYALVPLYTTVAQAALKDAALYEWLAIVDALRDPETENPDIARLALKDKLAGRLPASARERQAAKGDDHQLDLLSL